MVRNMRNVVVGMATSWQSASVGFPQKLPFPPPIKGRAAGLLFSMDPEATPSQVATVLCASARDLWPKGHDHRSGFGALDLEVAIKLADSREYKELKPLWPRLK